MAVVRVRRVDGENVIALPAELEDQGFAPGAEILIAPLEDGEGIALLLAGNGDGGERTLLRRLVERERPVLDRLEAYDRDRDA
ncbi:MAG: hypothetical protein WAM30_13170 [Candidatus Dormiibacterota bacterium]